MPNGTKQAESLREILLADGACSRERLVLTNELFDNGNIREKTVQRSRFVELGFKGAHFEDCIFNHSYFERCHFRKAFFKTVSFTNCFFRDCRFDEAEFLDCQFNFAEFENCSVTYDQLKSCLPTMENILWKLARNLRVNAQNRGQTEDYRKFLLAEIRASETHNFKKAFAWSDPYYGKKYPRWEDRLIGLGSWLGLKFEGFFWGHGEVPLRVIRSAAIFIVAFAVLFRWTHAQIQNMPHNANFLEYLFFSAAMFTTVAYGDVVPASFGARVLATLDGACGLIVFGFLVAALYRRISKR